MLTTVVTARAVFTLAFSTVLALSTTTLTGIFARFARVYRQQAVTYMQSRTHVPHSCITGIYKHAV